MCFYNHPASNEESDQKFDEEVLTEQDRITEENDESSQYFKYSGDACRNEMKEIRELSLYLDDQLGHLQ